ncbi:MAG: hypothetical protein KC431_11350 [Myxococcales bacterium]|nr:hypothetical protein [Myxococcales bacterium]
MTERQLWTRAALGSVVFHVGLVIVASLLPKGSRPGGANEHDELFTPGAVIPIEMTAAPLAALEPSIAPRPSAPSDPELPALAPEDSPPSTEPTPDSGTEPPPQPTEADPSEAPSAPGLLSGMRDGSRSSVTAGDRVIVDPSLLGGSRQVYEQGVNNPGIGNGGVQGPSAPPDSSVDYAFTREKGKLVYRDPGGRFIATLNADGRVDFRNKSAKGSWTQIGVGDPSGLISAIAGEDPYARAKAKLLKATFELRLGMAVEFQKKQIKKRLKRLEGELDKIWTDERRDLAARKELIFQRWDECEEPDEVGTSEVPGFSEVDTSEIDETRKEAAGEARDTIIDFVRERAPKGSAQAYTAGELADMNGRRSSKSKFSPY